MRGRPGSAWTLLMWSSTSLPTRPATTTAWSPSGGACHKSAGRNHRGANRVDSAPLLAILWSFGAVAQLGERHAGSVEVTGSIPVGSTTDGLWGARSGEESFQTAKERLFEVLLCPDA